MVFEDSLVWKIVMVWYEILGKVWKEIKGSNWPELRSVSSELEGLVRNSATLDIVA